MPEQTVVTLSDWKIAALFYDRVVPVQLVSYEDDWLFANFDALNWDYATTYGELGLTEDKVQRIRRSIMGPAIYERYLTDDSVLRHSVQEWFRTRRRREIRPNSFEDWADIPIRELVRGRREFAHECLSGICDDDPKGEFKEWLLRQLAECGVGRFDYFFDSLLLPPKDPEPGSSMSFPEVCIAAIQLPRTTAKDWEKVLEIRTDTECFNKLKRLRLMFHEQFEGKDRAYVEDALALRIDDYLDSLRKHGIETQLGAFRQLANSMPAWTAATVAAAGVVLGEPIATAIAAGAGVAVEIANLSLHFAERKVHRASIIAQSDVAYLVELKSKLQPRGV